MNPYILEFFDYQQYIAMVIGISYESPITYLGKIAEELNNKSICGLVLFDMLLYSGNGKDRFFEIYFNGKNFDTKSAKNVKLERLMPLRKKSSEVLYKNPQYVEDSILNKIQKDLLKNGCCI